MRKLLAHLLISVGFLVGTPEVTLAAAISDCSDGVGCQQSALPLLLRVIEQATPIPVELGMIGKLEKVHSDEGATISFCAAALSQKGKNYDHFIHVLHRELIKWSTSEGVASGRSPYFLTSSEKSAIVMLFTYCLEHDATSAAPETLYRLFQIKEAAMPRPAPANTFRWLIASADKGFHQAQFTLAKRIWDYGTKAPPEPLRAYHNAKEYHRLVSAAAEGGHLLAQEFLARFYLGLDKQWNDDSLVNVTEGLEWLKKLAIQSADLNRRHIAINWLGTIFLDGKIVRRDDAEALRWFKRIPDDALYKQCGALLGLAKIYREGRVVEGDIEQADKYQLAYTNNCVKS